ncbi:MAG: 23S rRNA (pseudouridine(1915)-N(3))-methyltransferase RlmH [Deltaproteobacteria bacterium]|nr:MAG: 23S rRNA (pseudouridine(1915)-N(3))-methyltransferase RlmH [Deltaproteobacteria bacterium]
MSSSTSSIRTCAATTTSRASGSTPIGSSSRAKGPKRASSSLSLRVVRIRIIAVGKAKDRDLRSLLGDYYTRIGRYAKLEEIEIKDGKVAEVAERLARSIPDRSRVVALEVDGQSMSSRGLATWLERAENQSVQTVVFLIGGAYGLPPELSKKADLRLSLSAMTLPHRLARLFLAEQIYRGFSILRGEPYDH